MTQTELNVPFAHVLAPDTVEYLRDEVTPEVWDQMHHVYEDLAQRPHPAGGGGSFYVLFLDPSDRGYVQLIHADQLYARYETKFYNEEIHLITPKK